MQDQGRQALPADPETVPSTMQGWRARAPAPLSQPIIER